jgi:hypothetical protein
MKTSILLKLFIVLPLIIFTDYLLMAILGCTSCLLGFGEDFYCGSFCMAGKIILALSIMFFFYLLYPDIKIFLKLKKNVAATQKQKDIKSTNNDGV